MDRPIIKLSTVSPDSLASYKLMYENLHYDQRLNDNQEGVVHFINKTPMFFAVKIVKDGAIAYPPPMLTPKN